MLQCCSSPPEEDSISEFVKDEMEKYGIPGCAYAIIDNGEIVNMECFGYANLDYKVPVTDSTLFAIASMDKQITATAVMMLWEDSLLQLDNTLDIFFDSVPEAWKQIRVKHLLSHTSGLPDEVAKTIDDKYVLEYSDDENFRHIASLALLWPPGEDWEYSDANFFLLQRIVENVSGMPYEKFLHEKMLEPLGMHQTEILNPYHIIPNKATNYFENDSGDVVTNIWRMVDFGPLYNDIGCSIRDFVLWDEAIRNHKLLNPSTYDLMWTPTVLNNGKTVSFLETDHTLYCADCSYGFAWELEQFNDHRIIFHGGYTGTSIHRFPQDSFTVIVFTNLCRGRFIPDVFARGIARLYDEDVQPYGLKQNVELNDGAKILMEKLVHSLFSDRLDSLLIATEQFNTLHKAHQNFASQKTEFGNAISLVARKYIKGIEQDTEVVCEIKTETSKLWLTFRYNNDYKVTFIKLDR